MGTHGDFSFNHFCLVYYLNNSGKIMNSTQLHAIHLYRQLLRNGNQHSGYNFRHYIVRRVREEYQKNKQITEEGKIAELLRNGEEQLQLIKRQVALSQLYPFQQQVIDD